MSQFTLQSGAQEQLQQPKLVCYRVITSMPCFKKKKKRFFFQMTKQKLVLITFLTIQNYSKLTSTEGGRERYLRALSHMSTCG